MKKNEKNFDSLIGLIASIIGIIQFILSIPKLFDKDGDFFYFLLIPQIGLTLRILLLIIIETSIAYFASFLYRKTEKKYFSIDMYLFIFIIISAVTVWTSFSNIQYLLLGASNMESIINLSTIFFIGSYLLSAFFVTLEMDKPAFVLFVRFLLYLLLLIV